MSRIFRANQYGGQQGKKMCGYCSFWRLKIKRKRRKAKEMYGQWQRRKMALSLLHVRTGVGECSILFADKTLSCLEQFLPTFGDKVALKKSNWSPQGSVLGPILFLLYVNDFQCSSDFFDFHLFADDTNLFCKQKNPLLLEENINDELINVTYWLCRNKLSLNIEKSSFVIFHPQ